MKMMRIVGPNADQYNQHNCQEAYGNYNPQERVNCVLSIMTELFQISVEELRVKLSQVFQHKEIVTVDEEKRQDMIFRPDTLTLMFRAGDDNTGLFELTEEDIDVFFDGQPYTLSKLTKEEAELAQLVRKIMTEQMTDAGADLLTKMIKLKELKETLDDIPGEIKGAMVARDIHLEKEDVSELSISPAEFYADKLQCPLEEMLWAITQAYDNENTVPIPNMEKGAVMFIGNNEVRVINGDDNVTSVIHIDVLYDADENGHGQCPCPECWKKRHPQEKVGMAPINRTLH